MPEHESRRRRVMELLAQDRDINKANLEEFHMQLQASLDAWEIKASKVRRGIIIAVVVYFGGLLLSGLFRVVAPTPVTSTTMGIVYGLILWPVIIVSLASFVIGIGLIVLYLFKYSPGVRRARYDVQTALLVDLHQKLDQLHGDLTARSGGSS